VAKGVTSQPLRQGGLADVIVSELEGRYYELCRNQRVFVAQAIVTTPVVYTTAAAGAFPLLWNGSNSVNAAILGVNYACTSIVTTTGSAIGLTGNAGQISPPTSTTVIDGMRCLYIGGPQPACSVYRLGTVVNAGNFLLPLGHLHSGTVATDTLNSSFDIDLGGALIVPPYAWCGVGFSVAPVTSSVSTISLIWAEIPIV
jgi:hypothetical protein